MEKRELINILDEIFIPFKFRRTCSNWICNGPELSKIINLQKSNYGNYFYLNYGFVIRGIKLTTLMHVFNRLSSSNEVLKKKIDDLLNLTTDIPFNVREVELNDLIINKIVLPFQQINTEHDLLKSLSLRPHLNDIPLIVKSHFKLS